MMQTYREMDLVRVLPVKPLDGGDGEYVVDDSTGTKQERIDIQTSVIYQGTAARGEGTNEPVWTIKRVELNAAGDPTTLQWTDPGAIWDNRTTEVYS